MERFAKHRGAFAVLFDQGLTSLAAFAISIVLARIVEPNEFGLFVLANTVLVTLTGVLSALIFLPYRVYAASGQPRAIGDSSLRVFLVVALLASTVGAAVIWKMSLDNVASQQLAATCYMYFLGAFSIEYTRAVLSTHGRWGHLIGNSLLVNGGRIAILAILAMTTLTRNLTVVLIAISVLPLSISLFSWWVFQPSRCKEAETKDSTNTAALFWEYGRWLLVENLAFAVSMQYFAFIVSIKLGAAELAIFGVAQTLLNLFNVFLFSLTSYALTSLRRALIAEGAAEWKRQITLLARVLVPLAGAISIACSIKAEALISLVFGDRHLGAAALIPMFGIVLVLNAINSCLGVAFRTTGLPQVGFFSRVMSAIVAVLAGNFLVDAFGVAGAVLGLLISQLIWLLVYVYFGLFRRQLSQAEISKRHSSPTNN